MTIVERVVLWKPDDALLPASLLPVQGVCVFNIEWTHRRADTNRAFISVCV